MQNTDGVSFYSTDESATETILKSQQVYIHLCGKLGLNTHRDAFITALCKASLPPYYALAVLQSHSTAMSKGSLRNHIACE